MIQSIFVKNFVLIDSINLDFYNSYSCFTGETGAGKSLLIDCISILCGSRISGNVVRNGEDKAFMELVMDVNDSHPCLTLLQDKGFEIEDNTFSVSREITNEGKSTAKINGRTTTLSFIREVMNSLIDIHSQHDTQYLLNNKYHLSLLDSYINEETLLNEVHTKYSVYAKKKKEYDNLLNSEFNSDDLDYLQYQIQEMDKLNISENEYEDLLIQQKEMSSFEKTSSELKEAISIIDHSNYESLYETNKILSDLDNEDVVKCKEELLNAYYSIGEQRDTLVNTLNSLYFDEDEYNEIQNRIYIINKAFRKHGGSYKSYIQKYNEYKEKIEQIENREEFIIKSENELNKLHKEYLKVAKELSKIRKEKATLLEKDIHKELKDLSLKDAIFSVDFKECESKDGIDQVEFFIQMNKGTSLEPLSKVASGGELSRLMLGLKTIFTRLANIETIIFDEIDNGVSGSVAFAIGKKMKEIGKNVQVISVTHLAPVAAHASYHYYVSKTNKEDTTITNIKVLKEDETIKELANIAQGSINESALKAAKELYLSTKE